MYVGCPLELRGIGMTCADVSSLQLLKLLLRPEFVRLMVEVLAFISFRWESRTRSN